MRLQQDEARWEREVADLFTELPAPRPARPASAPPPPRGGASANRCQTSVAGARRGDRPAMPVWATQRSPPSGPSALAERHCRTREVMSSPMITSKAATRVSPTMIPMSRHRG